MEPAAKRLGQSRVNPSAYFKLSAQATSMSPARIRKTQLIIFASLQPPGPRGHRYRVCRARNIRRDRDSVNAPLDHDARRGGARLFATARRGPIFERLSTAAVRRSIRPRTNGIHAGL